MQENSQKINNLVATLCKGCNGFNQPIELGFFYAFGHISELEDSVNNYYNFLKCKLVDSKKQMINLILRVIL